MRDKFDDAFDQRVGEPLLDLVISPKLLGFTFLALVIPVILSQTCGHVAVAFSDQCFV